MLSRVWIFSGFPSAERIGVVLRFVNYVWVKIRIIMTDVWDILYIPLDFPRGKCRSRFISCHFSSEFLENIVYYVIIILFIRYSCKFCSTNYNYI